MTTEISEKLYTVEEFLELDLPDDGKYELINGRIIGLFPIPLSAKQGKIVSRLNYYLQNYAGIGVGEKRLGEVYVKAACNLGQESSILLYPDICFVAKNRTPENFDGPIPVIPDLVVEVHSPADTVGQIYDKEQTYLQAGVRLLWSVYTANKFVIIYRSSNSTPELLNLSDELDGEDVVPGFRLPVSKLFE